MVTLACILALRKEGEGKAQEFRVILGYKKFEGSQGYMRLSQKNKTKDVLILIRCTVFLD